MEIDSEVVAGLCDAAPLSADLIWNRQGRIGLSITEQYASFAEVIEIAKAKIYKATQKLIKLHILDMCNSCYN